MDLNIGLVKDCRLRNEVLSMFGLTGDTTEDIHILASNRKKYDGEDFRLFMKQLKWYFVIQLMLVPNGTKDKQWLARLHFTQCLAGTIYADYADKYNQK